MTRLLRGASVLCFAMALLAVLLPVTAVANQCVSGDQKSFCSCTGPCWANATECGCGKPAY